MATQEIVVAKDGDVLFTFDRNEGESCSLRVSSTILSYASSVFKSTLGPNFSEGQANRSSSNPKHIDLPDDDPAAMVRLCRILHLNQTVDGKGSLDEAETEGILKVAILADKYDCVRTALPSLKLALMEWASRPGPTEDRARYSPDHLAATAFLLRLDSLCRLFTRRMVLDMQDSFLPLLQTPAGQVLPACFLLAVEAQRATLREETVQKLEQLRGIRWVRAFAIRADAVDDDDTQSWHDYLAVELDLASWPPVFGWKPTNSVPEKSLRKIIGAIDSLDDTELQLHDEDDVCRHETVPVHRFKTIANDLDWSACGVCCDCARDEFRSLCTHPLPLAKIQEIIGRDSLPSKDS